MAPHMLDDLDRPRLDWPEPLVIDLIEAAYGWTADGAETAVAARLHARSLGALIGGDTSRARSLRIELVGSGAARGISPKAIAAADHAVFQELSAIVQSRFRNSPRLRLHFVQQLHEALGALTQREALPKKAEAPRARLWPRLNLGPALAFSG